LDRTDARIVLSVSKFVSCAHQGEADVKTHLQSACHIKCVNAMDGQKGIFKMFPSTATSGLTEKVTRAEVKMAVAMTNHNIPLAFSDHISPLLRDIFPDSVIAKKYSAAKTKMTCTINGVIIADD